MAKAAFPELIRRPPTREEISNAAEVATAIAQAREADGKLIIAGADGQELHIAPAISELIVDLLGHIARGETTDFGVILSGTMALELDDGAEVVLSAGDVLIENGTRHRWRVVGDVPAILASFLIGARRR
jgi:Cupin domain